MPSWRPTKSILIGGAVLLLGLLLTHIVLTTLSVLSLVSGYNAPLLVEKSSEDHATTFTATRS